MSVFKELATLEERIEKDGVYLYVSRMIHKQYWDCDGPLKFIKFNPKEFTCVREFMNFEDLDGFELITNEEVLSLLRPISNSLCRLPDMMDILVSKDNKGKIRVVELFGDGYSS